MRVLAWYFGGVAVALSGCGQLSTSSTERAGLEAAAAKAGETYVDCVVEASDRYLQTGEDARMIVEVSKEACSATRSDYADADTTFLKSKYMRPEAILKRDLAALDERATALVEERVLERKAAAPPAAIPVTMAAPASASPDGNQYLDCMRAQGQRYAGVNEPAEVVAEVANSRCSTGLTDPASAAQLERQGRALVMGMVLDRKVSQ